MVEALNHAEGYIGVDLGIQSSCVAVCKDGILESMPAEDRQAITPSLVFFDAEESILFGQAAEKKAKSFPGRAVYDVKNIIGLAVQDELVRAYRARWHHSAVGTSGWDALEGQQVPCKFQIEINGTVYEKSAQEIAAKMLEHLQGKAKLHLGAPYEAPKLTVLTLPTWFKDNQREALLEAAARANLGTVATIMEPLAAAKAYGLDRLSLEEDSQILVFKLNRLVCEATLLKQRAPGQLYIVESKDSWSITGQLFVEKIISYLMEKLERQNRISEAQPLDANEIQSIKRALMNKITQIRQMLQKDKSSDFSSRDIPIDCMIEEKYNLQLTLKEENFTELFSDVYSQLQDFIHQLMREVKSDMVAEEVGHVILTGGSFYIPSISKWLKDTFRKAQIHHALAPEEVVAQGAAKEAYEICTSQPCHFQKLRDWQSLTVAERCEKEADFEEEKEEREKYDAVYARRLKNEMEATERKQQRDLQLEKKYEEQQRKKQKVQKEQRRQSTIAKEYEVLEKLRAEAEAKGQAAQQTKKSGPETGKKLQMHAGLAAGNSAATGAAEAQRRRAVRKQSTFDSDEFLDQEEILEKRQRRKAREEKLAAEQEKKMEEERLEKEQKRLILSQPKNSDLLKELSAAQLMMNEARASSAAEDSDLGEAEDRFLDILKKLKTLRISAGKFCTIAKELRYHGHFAAMEQVAEKALECDQNSIDANRYAAHAKIEIGKRDPLKTKKIKDGISSLEKARELAAKSSKHAELAAIIQIELMKARKIECLKQMAIDRAVSEDLISELERKAEVISKLYIVTKTPIAERIDGNILSQEIKEIYEREKVPAQSELRVPEHIICIISGEIMSDPVTLETGRSYERSQIEMLFQYARASEEQLCYCPSSLVPVNADVMIPNVGLRREAERFLQENPWAYEFDPREKFFQIKVWQ